MCCDEQFAVLASPLGGEMVGLEDGVMLQELATAQTEGLFYSSLYPSLKAAMSAWMANGGTLIINQDYTTETSVFGTGDGTFIAGKSYRLTTQGARTIKYAGTATHLALFRLYASGAAALAIDGDLTIDCDNLTGTALMIDFSGITGSNRRDALIRGVRTRKNRLNVAFALGANGIAIRGGFNFLHLDNCHVEGVTRAVGTGAVGSYGTNGIQYFGDAGTTANARHILIENGSVATVTSEDAPGTSAFQDMDGLLVFQYSFGGDDVTAPLIRNMAFKNCAGRAIKRYCPVFGGVTESISVERAVRGKYTGANEIVHQDGSGVIRDIAIRYSGDANVEPSTAIILAPSAALDNKGGSVDGVRIKDSTGANMFTVVSIYAGFHDSNKRAYSFRNISHDGTAQAFIRLGWNATVSDVNVVLENIDVNLVHGVGIEDDGQQYLKVNAYNFKNRGANVPAKVQLTNPTIGTMATTNWGDWCGDETILGVHRYVGIFRNNPSFRNGFRGPGGGVIDAPRRGTSEVFGRVPLGRTIIAGGATHSFPPVGSYQAIGGDFIVRITRQDSSPVAPLNLLATAGNASLSFLYGALPGGWDVRSTGGGSGSGTNIEVWKDNATQGLVIHNRTASAIMLDVTFNQ